MAASTLCAVSACTAAEPVDREDLLFEPQYRSASAKALATDLIQINVAMRGARDSRDLTDYADCAIAGYAIERGFGFARHVRTSVNEAAGIWQADAVYTVSTGLPQGRRTIDVEAQRNACASNGIPQLVRTHG